MTVRLTIASHGGPPQSSGIEIDDAGRATAYQDSGQRVGRFARELTTDERAALRDALDAAAAADHGAVPDPAQRRQRPSGTRVQVAADDLPQVVLDAHGTLPPGFEDLVSLLQELAEDLTESPVAALELVVAESPLGARLRHAGTEPLTVRLGRLTVEARLFGADSVVLDSATRTVDASDVDGRVEPGWSLDLAGDLEIGSPPADGFLTLVVGAPEVDVRGDGVLRRTELGWMTE